MAEGLDAVTKYWLEKLTPQTRLSYCCRSEPPKGSPLLSYAEYFFLLAMCCYSTDGAAVDRSLKVLARRAGMDRKTAQRLLNGYTDRNGVKKSGLKDRGIVSVQAPSENRKGKATGAHVLQINWLALTIDPNQRGYLERRAQKTLNGMKPRPIPEDDERAGPTNSPAAHAAPSANSGKAVSIPLTLGHNAQGSPGHTAQAPRTQCPISPGHNVHPPLGNVSGAKAVAPGFGVSGKVSAEDSSCASQHETEQQIREIIARSAKTAGLPQIEAKAKPEPKPQTKPWSARSHTTWATLHPGIRERVKKQLQILAEAAVGRNTYGWSPQEIARESALDMRLACQRAGVWDHVTDDLVHEEYERALAGELAKKEHN